MSDQPRRPNPKGFERGGHYGQNRGAFQGPPRGGQGPNRGHYQGPPRGGPRGPNRGFHQGQPRGGYQGQARGRGDNFGHDPNQQPFQTGAFNTNRPFQGPMQNASPVDGMLPTPNQKTEQTVREETTTTTYADGTRVTKTVKIKEGGSSSQPTTDQGPQGVGYPSPPIHPPPQFNTNMLGAPSFPPPPPMYGAPVTGPGNINYTRPPPPPPQAGGQGRGGRGNSGNYNNRRPPSNKGPHRNYDNRDRSFTREPRDGKNYHRSGSRDRKMFQKDTPVSLLDIAIDDDHVERQGYGQPSDSDHDSDSSTNSTTQAKSKGKQQGRRNKNKDRQEGLENEQTQSTENAKRKGEKYVPKENANTKESLNDNKRNSKKQTGKQNMKSKEKVPNQSRDRETEESEMNATDETKGNQSRKKSSKQRQERKQEEYTERTENVNDDEKTKRNNTEKKSKQKAQKSKKPTDDDQQGDTRGGTQERKMSESSDSNKPAYGPDVKSIFDYMVKEMNGKGSPKDIQQNSGLFPDSFDSTMIEEWFKRFSKRFKSIIRQDRVVFVFAYNREMNYCLDYISRQSCNKSKCTRYHVCKDMLCGYCKFWPSCRRSHDFLDSENENAGISRRIGLARYSNDEILTMMQCRYPHICNDWNHPKSCKNRNCEKLHICKKYLLNKCEDGDECRYGHERISDHNKPIVEAYEMTSWNDVNFRRIIYIQRLDEEAEEEDERDTDQPTKPRQQSAKGKVRDISEPDDEVILCDQYLLDNCHKKNCPLYHNEDLHLPYIWQIKFGEKWVSLSTSEEIEKEYCALNEHAEPSYVNAFDSGESELIQVEFNPELRAKILASGTFTEVRRVSTPSYKVKGPVKSFRTQWRWYKRATDGDFEQITPDKLQHTLEEQFLSGQKEYQFLSENLPYIDFTAMVMCDEENYTTVLRRPTIVTKYDVEQKKIPDSLPPPVHIPVPVPKGWAKWDVSEKASLVKLSVTSKDYKAVNDHFYSSFKSKQSHWPIKHIFRVQNYTLLDQFSSKEGSMKTALEHAGRQKSSIGKRYLFHGTDNFNAVKGICRENIDPRVSGKNATNFGDGAYFATEAFLAHMYTDQTAPSRYVFMVNVLVGDFTKGREDYRKPPEKPDTDGEYFDSCVDDVNKPMKFVLFDRTQYYPEYLIWYGENDA